MKDRKGKKRCPRCNFKKNLYPHGSGTHLCRQCIDTVDKKRWPLNTLKMWNVV